MDKQAHRRRWAELEVLLDQMQELPAESRESRLAELEERDPELHGALLRLLAAMDAEDSFLERGPLDLSGEDSERLLMELRDDRDASADPGRREIRRNAGKEMRFGPYRLLERLGSGGMAEVWLAERDDEVLRQKVAIKLLHPLTGAEAAERFHSERQILGALRHDGIAKILDAGADPGMPPYLVLEYVDGSEITEYCQAEDLRLDDRLRLFLSVCDAVAYAHRRLIVHRDLKPSNILVTKDGRVKLVDFGIAKLLDPSAIALAEAPMTRTGVFLMTPEYAAPEQIQGEAITTATDVYGLGVLLFELLTGKRPFDLQGKSPSEIERIVCESEPEKPSTGAGVGAKPPPRTESWRKRLRGDLDTIVLKAMRKEPDERYVTVRDLSDDVRRFLDGHPVAARPATFGYRAGKYVRRHRFGVAAATLVALALLAGVVATAWQTRTARREAARAQAVGDFLFDLFEGADPESNPGQPLTALDLVNAGATQVDHLEAGPRAQVDLLRILGTLYGKLGEVEKGESFLRRAVALATGELGAGSTAARESEVALAEHLAVVGDPQEAERILQGLLAAGAGENSAAAHTSIGVALMKRGRYEESERHLRQAIDLTVHDPGGAAHGSARMELGNLLIHQERWEDAEQTLREVLASREKALGRNHVDVATIRWNLAELMLRTARFADAEQVHREILEIRQVIYPNGHPDIARSLGQIGAAVQRQGRFEEAGRLYEQAVEAWDERFGRANPALGEILTNLAALRYRLGDIDGAVEVQSDALGIWREVWGDQDDNLVAAGLNNLGVMHRELGAYDKAGGFFEEALEMRRRLHGDGHATVGMSLANLGRLRMLEGRLAEAETHSMEGLSICERQLPAGHPALLAAQMAAGAVLVERGGLARALPLLTTAAEAYETMLPEGDARLGETHLWLGVAKSRLGDSEAGVHLTRAAKTLEKALGSEAALVRRARRELQAVR